MTNSYGRQVVLPLTNKSGGGVVAGDVVINDSSNNDAFTTTTSAGATSMVGVVQETIASNAVGRVLIAGYAALVNVNASVTRGNYGKTHTVAKQATSAGASRVAGAFCQFLTGGTTPDAVLFGFPDGSTGSAGSPGTPALTLSTTNSTGAAVTLVATDATIAAFDATVPVTQAFADTAATGSAGVAARRDHKHGMPTVSASETDLTAGDVTVTTAGTWYDVVSLTPASGTWNIYGKMIWSTSVANTDACYGRLLKGASTVLDEAEDDVLNNAGQYHTMPLLAGNISFDGATTVKIQITGARNGTILARRDISANSGSGHVDTKIVALRIA